MTSDSKFWNRVSSRFLPLTKTKSVWWNLLDWSINGISVCSRAHSWPHTIQVEVNIRWIYWPCRCRRCWSQWRWRHRPDRSFAPHSGSPGRGPRSGPRVPPSSCCDWLVAPPGWRLRPLDSRQWHRSHTASRSPAHLEIKAEKKRKEGISRKEGHRLLCAAL